MEWDETLACGSCIRGGYNFCFEGVDAQEVTPSSPTFPDTKCCIDDSCAAASSAAWSCSTNYVNSNYAMTACPQRQNKCGYQQAYGFNELDTSNRITINGLYEGESCSYRVKASCGAPYFALEEGSSIGDKITISYIEYASRSVAGAEVSEPLTPVNERDDMTNKEGQPARNQMFKDSGLQTDYSEQLMPERRRTADGKLMGIYTLDGQMISPAGFATTNIFEDSENFWETFDISLDPERSSTFSVLGYGVPTAGDYDPLVSGYKTFGTVGQGPIAKGLKDDSTLSCEMREILVSVTATADQGASTIRLEVGSVGFKTVPEDEVDGFTQGLADWTIWWSTLGEKQQWWADWMATMA
jgi:hypothetical protein